MPLLYCCRASRRSRVSCSAEALMSGAEPIPEIRPAGLTRVRRCAAAFAGFVAAFAASSAQAQTLTDALAEAYNTNPQLLAQRALLRATDEQVPQALSGWRPTVNLSSQVGGTRSAVTSQGLQMLSRNGASLTNYSTFYSNTLNLAAT